MVSKPTQKALLTRERKLRKTGEWGPWERIENPYRFKPGWIGEVDHVKRNYVFSVLIRDVGPAVHLAITSLSQTRPTWPEMQRIKDELAGPKATGVEVYPPQDEIVDGADMYHLWVFSQPLPFSLWRKPK